MAPPTPAGLELYLDVSDISDPGWLERLLRVIRGHCREEGFAFVVEGPLRSLDGTFFDLSVNSQANLEVIRRVVRAAEALGAAAAVLHLIAPRPPTMPATRQQREKALDDALAMARVYALACQQVGVVPTLENIPPVSRMREGQYYQSLIGMDPRDLRFVAAQTSGLRVTLDVSHAQLYVNCVRDGSAAEQSESVPAEVRQLVDPLRESGGVSSLDDYISFLEGLIEEVHISNARGILGEGLPYDCGDIDLDRMVRRLSRLARYLVTETIEPDPSHAVHMRLAQSRVLAALDHSSMGAGCGPVKS